MEEAGVIIEGTYVDKCRFIGTEATCGIQINTSCIKRVKLNFLREAEISIQRIARWTQVISKKREINNQQNKVLIDDFYILLDKII